MTAKHPMIPLLAAVKTADGDIETINQIIRHYSGLIASRSIRPAKDEYGNTYMVVDETLRRRMETRLIAKILSFEIKGPDQNNALLWKHRQAHVSQTEPVSLLKCIITSTLQQTDKIRLLLERESVQPTQHKVVKYAPIERELLGWHAVIHQRGDETG